MELRRDIYNDLVKWKEEYTGRVLELKGARQVGKTYILKKFAQEHFKKVIYISMAEPSGKDFLRCITVAAEWQPGQKRIQHPLQNAVKLFDPEFVDGKETVIILDEIQESVEVYNQIRTFAREFKSYVIMTGSYLGRIIQPGFFLPAGDTDGLSMKSLSFAEFLDVFEKRELYDNIDLFGKGQPEDYKQLKEYYEIYQRIGGYPAVVVSYTEEKDIEKCYQMIKNLMTIFIEESKRYFTDIVDINIFDKLFNSIALLALKEKQGIRDLTTELSKIAYQEESGRMTKKMVNHAISWLQESHIIGYASKAVDCDYEQIKDNNRYYFLDMGIAYHFFSRTGASFDNVKGILAENFVFLNLRNRIDNRREIAGIAPWFASHEKTKGELDFYVRSLLDYKDYGIEVKSTDAAAKTARALLADKKLDYLYFIKGESQGGIAEEGKIFTVPLCLADRIRFDIGKDE